MDLFLGEESVTFNFGTEPNKHCLFIDVKGDRLYLDSEHLLTTKKEFNYNKDLMFGKNKEIQKKRIKTIKFEGKVLAIDVGFDGRVFFKFFAQETYSVFRAPPFKTMSYWHDRRGKEKKFYFEDLHLPKKTWKTDYKSDLA